MPNIPAAIVSRLVESLTALPASRAAPAAKVHVQMMELTILPGDRMVEPSIALTADLPVRMTVTNTADEFHTFTVPALGMEGAT